MIKKNILVILFLASLLFNAPSVFSEPPPAEGESHFVYNDHGKRDPMWELVTPNGAIQNYDSDFEVSDLVLEGVMLDQRNNSLAIINGKVLKVKDLIGPYTVSAIQKDVVILLKGDQKLELKLKKGE